MPPKWLPERAYPATGSWRAELTLGAAAWHNSTNTVVTERTSSPALVGGARMARTAVEDDSRFGVRSQEHAQHVDAPPSAMRRIAYWALFCILMSIQ